VKPVSTEQGDPDGELAPELMRYLNRDYWEQKERDNAESKKQAEVKVTTGATASMAPMAGYDMAATQVTHNLPPALAGGAIDPELDEFVTTLKTQVEIFVNRMKSNSSRGRSITNDSSVQTLFMNTMAMHSKLLKHIQDQEDKRVYYEGLQDKIVQVKDARAALDALREEERERKRREAEEAERLRQIQMREKLEVMRKKKQEYLQYQRQVALQRMQEQEREMKLRQEQAKQQYMMMQQQGYGQPPMVGGQPMPPMYGMPPPGQAAPPYMHYPPYMGQPAPATGGSPMHGGGAPLPPPQNDPAAFNMQGMAGALPPMSHQAGAPPPPNPGAAPMPMGAAYPPPMGQQPHDVTMGQQPPPAQQMAMAPGAAHVNPGAPQINPSVPPSGYEHQQVAAAAAAPPPVAPAEASLINFD